MTDPGDPNPLVRRLTRRVQDAALSVPPDAGTLRFEAALPSARPASAGRRSIGPALRRAEAPRSTGWGCMLAAVAAAVAVAAGVWYLTGIRNPPAASVADGGSGSPTTAGAPKQDMMPAPPTARPPDDLTLPGEWPTSPKPDWAKTPATAAGPPASPQRPTEPPPLTMRDPGEYAVADPRPGGGTATGGAPAQPGNGGGASVAATGGGGTPAAPAGSTTSVGGGGDATGSMAYTWLVAAGVLLLAAAGTAIALRPPAPPAAERTVTLDPHRTTTAGPAVTLTHAPGRDFADAARMPVLDRYKLVRHLGEGAYGTVFLGIPADRPGDRVAVKFFAYHSARWALLQAEVKRLTDLGGLAGVVQLHEVEADADPPYFVMRYAEGGSLAGKLQGGPLPPADVLPLAKRLADALAGVHARGIVHCDLKPGNVLLDADGCPLLADFGQAQMVGEDAPALGTLFYMPPEQADPGRRPPDPRWDVYALGATLHAVLCGRPPHAADTVRSALHRTPALAGKLSAYRAHLLAAEPPTAHRGRCPELAGVIDRCLRRDPAERFADAAAVAAALV